MSRLQEFSDHRKIQGKTTVRLKTKNKYTVFFDFDKTITSIDVIDNMLPIFSKDKHWVSLEDKWVKGKIGSKICLDGQIRGIRASDVEIDKYLSGIQLDPYFKKTVSLLDSLGIKYMILSDDFDYIISKILANHGIKNVKFRANHLSLSHNRLNPSFPFINKNCDICAHCKTKNLLANATKNSIIIYIGDGQSDACPAGYADLVFAKEPLLRHCKQEKITCVPFKALKDVYGYLKRSLE